MVIGKAVGPHACVGPTAFVNASASRLHPSPSEGRKQQQRIGPMARMRRTKARNFGPKFVRPTVRLGAVRMTLDSPLVAEPSWDEALT